MKLRLFSPFLHLHPTLYGDPAPPAPAPAAPAAPAGGNAPPGGGGDDLMNMTAPPLEGSIGDLLDKPPTPGAKSEPPPAKPGEPKPGEPKPGEPKPGKTPAGDPPVKQLRDELEVVKRERDELKTRFEAGDPRLKAAEDSVKAKEAEIADSKKRIEEYEKQLALANPEVTKKLAEHDQNFDAAAMKYARLAALDQTQVNSFVREYSSLPFGKPEYKEARAAFEAKVNETLGGSEDSEHRKLNQTLDFIERTYDFVRERQVLEKDVKENALQRHREYQTESYTKQAEWVRSNIEKAKVPPEGMKETDPYHPKIMLDVFEQMIPEDKRASYTAGLPEFIETVMAGVKPRTDADYNGMSPEAIRESQAREHESYEQKRAYAVDVMYNGLRALRMFPTLVKEITRLRAKVGEEHDGAPPDPTKPPGGESRAAGDDLKTFEAPNLDNVNI